MEFAATLAARLDSYGAGPFVEFERRWYTGDDLSAIARATEDALARAGVGPGEAVGVLVRNRVPHAAVVLGAVARQRPLVMINSYRSAGAIAREVAELGLAAIVAGEQDWTAELRAACAAAGSAGVTAETGRTVCARHGATATAASEPDVPTGRPQRVAVGNAASGLHILTSGTTGPPKRVAIGTAALAHTVLTMTGGRTAEPDDPPELVYWPFGSIGICQLLAVPFLGTRMVLMERFTVPEWVRAVRDYRVRRAGVQPTILRMLLDAKVPPEDLASLEYLPGGSGPLEPGLRAEFEQRYGIPLLWAYGATEFAGSVCAWTPELHRSFGQAKAGSVGRPLPGVDVRIVDPETGAEVAPGERGRLEARVAVLGPDWIRTTDLASRDADDFVTIHGRADGAINRGGFKVLPETVRVVLIRHPAVRDACVVGVPDPRLGQVPFAAVELRSGHAAPAPAELLELVREELPSHHIPVDIAVLPELPRNAAMKVRTDAVAALYGGDRG
ncbi:class I adenylate-forming enzyme family protein [Nocardia jiangsuensis]|uniref:Class I adenylate-forming enzyme family protein n=1 Tax=Nocardia jiangsuensis TaxID=1691563 RepID=A0ABV8DM54_9NOCA